MEFYVALYSPVLIEYLRCLGTNYSPIGHIKFLVGSLQQTSSDIVYSYHFKYFKVRLPKI